MATTQETPKPQQPRKVIFSFAAYAKEIICALQSSDVHVTTGLTPSEISAVESVACFTFPPDLRSILSEGLPVGPGFPNWRSSSHNQLRLITSLPLLTLLKEVSRNNFWANSWGPRPNNIDEAQSLAKRFLSRVPRLVPVYRHCYVPCDPSLVGNPVFYVHGVEVSLLCGDVGEFFKGTKFLRKDWVLRTQLGCNGHALDYACAWGGGRKVEFWSEVAGSWDTRRKGWWRGELGECFEEVVTRLREGGWGEEDVREMMMLDGGEDEGKATRRVRDKEGVVRHVRSLSKELLSSGWSVDDVVYSLGGDDQEKGNVNMNVEGENWVDFHCLSANQNSLVLSR